MGSLGAQTATNENVWVQLFHEHRVDGRWSLTGEAQFRRSELGKSTQQLLLRPGVSVAVSPRLRLGAGYAFVDTERYGDAPVGVPFPEHRLWQHAVVSAATGDVTWQGRLRLEQRWLGVTRFTPTRDVEVMDWRFRQRARGFLRASLDATALGVDVPSLYATAWNEFFVHLGGAVNGRTIDQNRATVQLGWRASPRFRIEAGYMQQYIVRGAPGVSEVNHSVIVSLWTTSGAP